MKLLTLLMLTYTFGMAIDAHAQAMPDPPVVSASLSLRDALAVASANNVTLAQAQADAHSAAAAAHGAQAQTRPGLSATTYATAGDSPNIVTTSPSVAPQNIFSVPARGFADQNVMLMVPLYTGGRLGGMAASARKQGEAAALSTQAAGLTVTEAVTESYAAALLQNALVEVAQARLTAEDEQVRSTGEKVSAGRLAPVDLLRERAEQAAARQALLAAQNSAALALVNLKGVLGVSQASQIALSDTLDRLAGASAADTTLPDTLRLAVSHRPELMSARKLVDAAQADARAARGAYAPQVYGVAMGDVMTGQGSGRAGYTVGLTASLPLYDGGQRAADADAARARLERAQADALQVRQMVDQQVSSAWLLLQTAMAEMQAASEGADAAREAYHLANLRYNAGKSVTAERLDALSALTRAQGAVAQAKADLVTARAKLQAAHG